MTRAWLLVALAACAKHGGDAVARRSLPTGQLNDPGCPIAVCKPGPRGVLTAAMLSP